MSSIRVVERGNGVRFDVRVQPRASRSEIVGPYAQALKVRVAAPPVDGSANDALVDLLAREMGVAKRDIRIVGGLASRNKTVEVSGVAANAVHRLAAGVSVPRGEK
ncbi:MAG TPA: DUF167 domain-containing protein [Gemmatimonadaceae bacterium]